MIGNWWEFLSRFLGPDTGSWIGALVVVVIGWLLRLIVFFIADCCVRNVAKRTKTELDDKLLKSGKAPAGNLVFLWTLYWAVNIIGIPSGPFNWRSLVFNIIDTLVILTVLWLVLKLIQVFMYFIREGYRAKGQMQFDQLLPFIRDVARVLAVVGAVVWVIIAWGKDPSVLLAGLGIGGLAIGFAAKDTIANIFGSVTIFADKPFDVGDWVSIGKEEGVVEEVGFRTTKIRTFEKTLIIIPNSLIANSAINNFSRMPLTRVKQRIGIVYETPVDKVKEVVEGMRKLLNEHPGVADEPRLVYFEDFTDSALVIIVDYFTLTTERSDYLAIRQDLNLEFMTLLEDLGVEFAYPTQTLWHKGDLGFGNMPRLGDGDFDTDI